MSICCVISASDEDFESVKLADFTQDRTLDCAANISQSAKGTDFKGRGLLLRFCSDPGNYGLPARCIGMAGGQGLVSLQLRQSEGGWRNSFGAIAMSKELTQLEASCSPRAAGKPQVHTSE